MALGPMALGPKALGPMALGPKALGPKALGPSRFRSTLGAGDAGPIFFFQTDDKSFMTGHFKPPNENAV